MRQVGYLAAAGLYALQNNINRLSDDHRRAKEIAKKFSSKDIVNKINSVETNIIIVELNKSVNKQQIINHFTNHNVIFDWYSMGVQKIRIVTHLDYTEKDHEDLIEIVDKL